MKKNTFLKNILIIIILIGVISTLIDYSRIKTGKMPVLNIKKYNQVTKIQTFRGIFYKLERTIKVSESEVLSDSSNIKLWILAFNIDVSVNFEDTKNEYVLETKEISNCQETSKLYFADKDIKVYTYCLDKISIKKDNKKQDLIKYLEKDNDIINDIDSKLTYLGLYSDQTALMFESNEKKFTNNGLTMYRCNTPDIKDVYIAPKNTEFQDDFCIYKDDDFKFMWEIKEDEDILIDKEKKKEKEIISEDEIYRYEFDEVKSHRIFIITPAVRGKEEARYPLKEIINNKILTLDELAKKGLKFTKINKKKEQEELLKKQKLEEEKRLKEELEQSQITNKTEENTNTTR